MPSLYEHGPKTRPSPPPNLPTGWTLFNVTEATDLNRVDDAVGQLSVNVKHPAYGAKGDGVTDDTAAIQAAYNVAKITGAKLYFPPGTYLFNLIVDAPNIFILGSGASATASEGGNGNTVFKPKLLTSPVIQVGNGTSVVNQIRLAGFTMIGDGAGSTSDGLVIKGADWVLASNITIEGFGRDGVRLESSATRPTTYVFLDNVGLRWNRASCLKATQGSQYVAAVFASNMVIQGWTTAGTSYAIYLDSVGLAVSNTWIQAGGNGVGHVFLDKTGSEAVKLRASTLTIDSGSSSDVLVEIAETRSYVATYLDGAGLNIDGLVKWGDASTTDATNTGEQVHQGKLYNAMVLQNLYFNQSNAASADEPVVAGSLPRITRSGSGSDAFLQVKNTQVNFEQRYWQAPTDITYSASMTPDGRVNNVFRITITDGVAHTINGVSNGTTGQRVLIKVKNMSGGAAGAATWAATYKLAGAWVQPATGFTRWIEFLIDGSSIQELWRSAADIAN